MILATFRRLKNWRLTLASNRRQRAHPGGAEIKAGVFECQSPEPISRKTLEGVDHKIELGNQFSQMC